MGTEFEYYAFISYKREDEKWARWLQNNLEHYTLPSVIRKEMPLLPKQIRPVFRDKTHLGAGMLTDTLRKELEMSRYLIVICSPRSVSSEWVGKEIAVFIENGRADKIIPFIVEGTPNSNDARECLHHCIRKNIPDALGINVNEIGRQQAFAKVVAKLLDLRFDLLWNRFLIKQRQNRLVIAALSLILLTGLGVIWNYIRTEIEYYADYVDEWGIPKGIIKLNKSQINKREAHYRFESSRRKLQRVVYANSSGKPINHNDTEYIDRPSIQKLNYTKKRLFATELKNAGNQTIATYFWGGKKYDRIDIKTSLEGELATSLAASFTSITSNLMSGGYTRKADIKRFKLTRNDAGYIIRKEFKRHNGDDAVGARDAHGIWGFDCDLDSLGRPATLRYLGNRGENYQADKIGVMGRQYKYDDYGNICRVTYFDNEEKPVLNEQYWATAEYIADNNGNIIVKAYYNIDGSPCLNINGYAKFKAKYDERGNKIEETFIGIDDKPCLHKVGVSRFTAKYDELGNRIEEAYFDIDGKPCLHQDGYAKLKSQFDKRGNKIEQIYLGLDNKPCLNKDTYARETLKFDEYGNVIEKAFFGVDDTPCLHKDGYAKFTAKYDEFGNRIERAFFGVDGNPCLQKDGYAKFTAKHDELGNRIERIFFDTDGNSCLIGDGYSKHTAKYDRRGNRTEQAYFDSNGSSCLHKDGYARLTSKYDERGNKIEEAYFGVDGSPCLHRDGYAKWTAEYDERGNVIERTNFGLDGKSLIN